ncbi:4Fe-4S binding protein [Shewanella maritima]|uniref:FMN-binding protein n=1 Tax=Shewanella maritima TaxID=2520507 RepID=UPI0037369496
MQLTIRAVIKGFAVLGIFLAFLVGEFGAQPNYQTLIEQQYPTSSITKLSDSGQGYARYEIGNGGQEPFLLLIAETEGYGGPMVVATEVFKHKGSFKTGESYLLLDKETLSYVISLEQQLFFNQLENHQLNDNFQLGDDLDGYSGATITARGISSAMRTTLHPMAIEQGLEQQWQGESWHFGSKEVLLLILVVAAIASCTKLSGKPAKWLKKGLPIAALLIVGYYTNSAVSITHFLSLLLGYIPSPQAHPAWWVLMGAIVGCIVIMGRNIYCHKLCPFSAVQGLLNTITGLNLSVPRWLVKNSRTIVLSMIWTALCISLISRNPSISGYEPFSMLFSLEGVGLQWYIMPMALFGAMLVPDFWCRFFCPVGLTINEAVKLRRKATKHWEQRISVREHMHKGGKHEPQP